MKLLIKMGMRTEGNKHSAVMEMSQRWEEDFLKMISEMSDMEIYFLSAEKNKFIAFGEPMIRYTVAVPEHKTSDFHMLFQALYAACQEVLAKYNRRPDF